MAGTQYHDYVGDRWLKRDCILRAKDIFGHHGRYVTNDMRITIQVLVLACINLDSLTPALFAHRI